VGRGDQDLEGVNAKELYVLRDYGFISLFMRGQSAKWSQRTDYQSHCYFICTDSSVLFVLMISV
jgi:hypothetical protein